MKTKNAIYYTGCFILSMGLQPIDTPWFWIGLFGFVLVLIGTLP